MIVNKDQVPKGTGHTVRVVRIVVKWRSGMGNGVDSFDSLVECAIFGDILDNNKLKSVTVVGKFIGEEGTLGQ